MRWCLNILPCVLGALCLAGLSGCGSSSATGAAAAADRTEKASCPFPSGATLEIESQNGSVVITGQEGAECKLLAGIRVKAASEKQSKELAGKVKVNLKSANGKVIVKVDRPAALPDQLVTVNLDLAVPMQARLDVKNENGGMEIVKIAGPIAARSANGSIHVKDCSGRIEARTQNGAISCSDIQGDCDLSADNGRVTVSYARNAPGNRNMKVVSQNGGIDFTGPPAMSVKAEALARNGTVSTALPLKVSGLFDKRLRGTIGKGEGRLSLETANGSIKLQ